MIIYLSLGYFQLLYTDLVDNGFNWVEIFWKYKIKSGVVSHPEHTIGLLQCQNSFA
jgi:hypothetical protein